jgi:glycosyltransferase involved in cell wall biosynthesis
MLNSQNVVVVMPAYNAERTLRRTYSEVMAQKIVDQIILVDDASTDSTYEIAASLPNTRVIKHQRNKGYGANQKTCYLAALDEGADIIIMVHPDYQYTPKLIPAMAVMIESGLYDCVLGSRILGGYALKGGMPLWRYVANRFLTLCENLLMGSKLSEYHTGYRAFSRRILNEIPFLQNSDDFIFDNQILAQILWQGYIVAEVSCPTSYFAEASSINFSRSLRYGFGCLATALSFRLAKMKIRSSSRFSIREPLCGTELF